MNSPLVTVGVLLYNSANTVVETLNSIYQLQYKNIELLLADDCSSDNTVEICNEWLLNHSGRFIFAKFITAGVNKGIPANCNRIIKDAHGKYLKIIAGDDILYPDCIDKFVDYAKMNNSYAIASKAKYYIDNFNEQSFNKIETERIFNTRYKYRFGNSEKELKQMVMGNWICSPSTFFNIDIFKIVGKFDEKYRFCEDYPFYIKLLEKGITIDYMDEYTVGYRLSSNNTCRQQNSLFKMDFSTMIYNIQQELCFKYYTPREKRRCTAMYRIKQIFEKCKLNRDTWFYRLIFKRLNQLTFFIP